MTIEVDCVVKKWGNSYGLPISKSVLQNEGLKENSKVHIVLFNPKHTLKDCFGMLKGKKTRPTQEIKDELRRELYDD